MTRPTWEACYAKLIVAFDHQHDPVEQRAYFDELALLPCERMMRATTLLLVEANGWPTPDDLRAAAARIAKAATPWQPELLL
jgi:hypothetical protein